MSTHPSGPDDRNALPADDDEGGKVIPLRPGGPSASGGRGGEVVEAREVSYEIALDEEPERVHPPIYADVTGRDEDIRVPIIPASLRGWANVKKTVHRSAGRAWHRFAAHAVRLLPLYVPQVAFWSVVGVFRLAKRQLRWWWVPEVYRLEQDAANRAGHEGARDYNLVHRTGVATRRWRGIVLAGELVAVVVAVSVLVSPAVPWWVRWVTLAVVVPVLAHFGRPLREIVKPAVLTPRYRLVNQDIVAQAYYAAKLGDPGKEGQQVAFPPPGLGRDAFNQGSQVLVDLPYGRTFADVVKARAALASGLDVTEQQVFLTRDKTSTRRHRLFIADVDPLAIPAGPTPLLDGKPRDIWTPAPMGLDERGQLVSILLLWISVLIGAQPRKGKTFSARLLALFAALDPYVRLTVVDGRNSPDWDKFRLVAHRTVFGTHPNPRTADPIGELLAALREIKRHIQQVNEFLSTLPVSECPEGKLTRDLARRYPQCRVWLLVMEEFQVYFETEDQEVNKEIAGLLSFIQAVGPSAGVSILSSTQKPAQVGAGDVQRLFNRYRDNHTVRFALKCGNRDVSNAVLGADAYSEGYDASALPVGPEYRGVGYLYGASDTTPTVRCHLADHQDAEKILTAARRHRQAAGTLTGAAAGEDTARQVRDVLADARAVFHAGEARVSWQQIAARLAEQMPEAYADATQDAISAQVRALGVPHAQCKQPDGSNLRGAKLADIEQAITRRQIEGRR